MGYFDPSKLDDLWQLPFGVIKDKAIPQFYIKTLDLNHQQILNLEVAPSKKSIKSVLASGFN